MPGDPAPLFDRALGSPIVGLKASAIQDTFAEARGGGERRHEATDILAPRGTPVVAVDTGIIAKMFDSKPGGLTVYQFDPAQKYAYYYAHLDRYAEGLKDGMLVKKGDRHRLCRHDRQCRPEHASSPFRHLRARSRKTVVGRKANQSISAFVTRSGKIRKCASTMRQLPRVSS